MTHATDFLTCNLPHSLHLSQPTQSMIREMFLKCIRNSFYRREETEGKAQKNTIRFKQRNDEYFSKKVVQNSYQLHCKTCLLSFLYTFLATDTFSCCDVFPVKSMVSSNSWLEQLLYIYGSKHATTRIGLSTQCPKICYPSNPTQMSTFAKLSIMIENLTYWFPHSLCQESESLL